MEDKQQDKRHHDPGEEGTTETSIPILLVTANVGSIFEDPEVLLQSWKKEFLKTVKESKAKFLALHCQEVGGKNYEDSMKHVDHFVRSLLQSEELVDFIHVKVFLDEDFTSTAKFTALGNLYFIHSSINDCQIFDFKEQTFVPASGQEIFTGNIEEVSFKEKDKFPRDFFPDCKWSRKGFLRTRWSLSGVTFDLINIHLFHDASNFTAMEEYPSSYTKTRQDALRYTLDRLDADEYDNVPFFLFGDFNFRLNTGEVIKKITRDLSPQHIKHQENGKIERILYKNESNGDPFLTVEKKVFDLTNQEDVFYLSHNHEWLLQHDNELEMFKDRIYEYPIEFPPSYPFTEDNCGTTYMKTRCPAWCDRILLSHNARDIIETNKEDNSSHVSYQMMGADVPMGDHKPIMLLFRLKSGKHALSLEERFDQRQKENGSNDLETSDVVESDVLRFRTNSNPSVFRPHLKTEARRINSLLPQETDRLPKFHSSSQWLTRTQQLLRSLRLREEHESGNLPDQVTKRQHHKHRLTRLSSRLTSHHSSSDEEWYSDLQVLPDAAEPNVTAPTDSTEGTIDTVKSIPTASSRTELLSSQGTLSEDPTAKLPAQPPPPPSLDPPNTVANSHPTSRDTLQSITRLPESEPLTCPPIHSVSDDETLDKMRQRKKRKCCTKCVVT